MIAEAALQGGEDFKFVGDFGHGGFEPALLLARGQQPGQVADPESHKGPRRFGVVVLGHGLDAFAADTLEQGPVFGGIAQQVNRRRLDQKDAFRWAEVAGEGAARAFQRQHGAAGVADQMIGTVRNQ